MTKRTGKGRGTQAGNGAAGGARAEALTPLVAGMTATRTHLLEWVHTLGVDALQAVCTAAAEALAGPKGKHQPERTHYHWGRTRRIQVARPRVLEQILLGVSTRGYAASLEAEPPGAPSRVIDGGEGLRKAVQAVLGTAAVIQRCQLHNKARNLLAVVPTARQAYVRAMLRRAYRAGSADAARRQLKALAAWLEANGHVDVAASLREGLEETLTVLKLGLPPRLRRFFATTNGIENLIGTVRHVTRNIKRWCDGTMIRCWVGLALGRAATRFRRIKGHRELATPAVGCLGRTEGPFRSARPALDPAGTRRLLRRQGVALSDELDFLISQPS